MDKKEFSQKILKCSYSLWRAALVGDRNLSFKKARVASHVLNTTCDVWQDPSRVVERQAAWQKFGGK